MRELNPEYVATIVDRTNRSPYFTLLSMSIRGLFIGSCLVEIALAEKHLQPFGFTHGGALASIIDAATFWAVFPEVGEEDGLTSVDLKLNYLAPIATGKLIAHGRRIKLGKTLGLGEAEVTDEDGKLLAHGLSTLMVMPNWEFKHGGALPKKFLDSDTDS